MYIYIYICILHIYIGIYNIYIYIYRWVEMGRDGFPIKLLPFTARLKRLTHLYPSLSILTFLISVRQVAPPKI